MIDFMMEYPIITLIGLFIILVFIHDIVQVVAERDKDV